MLQPRFEHISEKRIIGVRMNMSFAAYRIAALWSSFMPKRALITHTSSSDLISLVNYAPNHFTHFSVHNEFERWAACEVGEHSQPPEGMESTVIPAGRYAVFLYQGLSSDPRIFQYIYQEWLPSSGYQLDDRPHFEVLGSKYKNNDPSSEEEIWIPIR